MKLLGIVFLIFAVLFSPAYAQAPDYFNPSAKFSTDKELYSWTDKVRFQIISPSWNSNKYLVDTIGNYQEHPITISTREQSLKPYTLTETNPAVVCS